MRYLGSKGLTPSEHWTDVWREEHATSFTAARMAQTDLLVDVQGELVRALAEGTPMRQFVEGLAPRLRRMGWAPPAAGGDIPTRLARIYDTNLRTARAAGQWDRIERTRDALPFLLYQLGPSLVHREEHLRWEGLLLRADDEFWGWAMPPNGFGCKCHVRQVGEREADRLERDGITYRAQRVRDPKTGRVTREDRHVRIRRRRPERRMRDWTNPATGETRRVTDGIGPGFDYNPGRDRPRGVREAMNQQFEDLLNVACPVHG